MSAPACPACGKKAYRSRKSARLGARLLHPSKRMRAYRCGAVWHLTSQPPQDRAARLARQKRLQAASGRAAA